MLLKMCESEVKPAMSTIIMGQQLEPRFKTAKAT